MNILELKDVKIVNSLSFKTENITFSVKKGENICVVGPSGCGKDYYFKVNSWICKYC